MTLHGVKSYIKPLERTPLKVRALCCTSNKSNAVEDLLEESCAFYKNRSLANIITILLIVDSDVVLHGLKSRLTSPEGTKL